MGNRNSITCLATEVFKTGSRLSPTMMLLNTTIFQSYSDRYTSYLVVAAVNDESIGVYCGQERLSNS